MVKKPPVPEGSSVFELSFGGSMMVGMIGVLTFIPPPLAVGIGGFWALATIVIHIKIWRSGGWPAFAYTVGRFPHAWLITLSSVHLSIVFRLLGLAVHALNPFGDNPGLLYKFGGDGRYSLRRFSRYAMDLDKPLLHRLTSPLDVCCYPFLFSPTSMGMLYVWGPYAMLSVLHCFAGSGGHLTTRTDVLSTEPSYHNHTTVFFNESSGAGYHHTCLHTFGPWPLFYRAATSLYVAGIGAGMRESEARTATLATQTFAGRLLQNQFDMPPFELRWQPGAVNGPLRPRATPMPAFDRKPTPMAASLL